MRNGRIPVLVLAGFLGSGKTTLLNHLLSRSLDVRIGVVVNDFGSVGVDAMLVGSTRRATGGATWCTPSVATCGSTHCPGPEASRAARRWS